VLALQAARLFDGERLLTPPALMIEGGKVVAAGVSVPEMVPAVDLGDQTLMPGLIDCHQHLCFDGNGSLEEQVSDLDDEDLALRVRTSAKKALRGGVTTLRDLGDRGFVTLSLRGDSSLPTILAAGPPITREGGHCGFLGGTCSTSDADLSRAVTERVERGCDVVKVMATGGHGTPTFPMWEAQFTVHELRVIVDEAHRAGLPVSAHCHGIVGIERALDAGADSIEHCSFYTNRGPEPNESLLARLASSGAVISATFGELPDYPRPPEFAAGWAILMPAFRRLHELGAAVVAGTDAGIVPEKSHGVLPYAVGDLIEIGMSPVEALRSLTVGAAAACGVADRKGKLAPGFDADIITVAGDPLVNPDALFVVSSVWRAGERVSGD
jgi:imidazolonepropionase-like amidohydrolase